MTVMKIEGMMAVDCVFSAQQESINALQRCSTRRCVRRGDHDPAEAVLDQRLPHVYRCSCWMKGAVCVAQRADDCQCDAYGEVFACWAGDEDLVGRGEDLGQGVEFWEFGPKLPASDLAGRAGEVDVVIFHLPGEDTIGLLRAHDDHVEVRTLGLSSGSIVADPDIARGPYIHRRSPLKNTTCV